ncbi:hypothetical protein ACOMHN_008644 [Nucella lapillus]
MVHDRKRALEVDKLMDMRKASGLGGYFVTVPKERCLMWYGMVTSPLPRLLSGGMFDILRAILTTDYAARMLSGHCHDPPPNEAKENDDNILRNVACKSIVTSEAVTKALG